MFEFDFLNLKLVLLIGPTGQCILFWRSIEPLCAWLSVGQAHDNKFQILRVEGNVV